MSACPACRAELPDGARFCPSCGARVEDDRPEVTERKVVTTLFADLVGFTALGERHDPEDVDAALRGYYVLARTIIERFGGVVEKFIGDAVVGLFGVPIAHEDDAERAVRAALEFVTRLHELPPVGEEKLQVRCAVNTGPALVRLHARPEAGEGVLVGDAVNTCARLLAASPAMSVVAGERTHALTQRTIAYRPVGRLQVRGKEQSVQTWLAEGQIARRGVDLGHSYGAPLVGREVELGVLKGMLARAKASSTPQLALVTGEPGVGKTRVAVELARWIDQEPEEIVIWRQGRCLPYGEGSGFQPLADVVRGHSGITETDDEATVTAKLDRTVPDGPDHDWVAERLRALLGLDARPAGQDENFSAWSRFLDDIGGGRPAVVFFDDLHWADDAMLAFLGHLVDGGCTAPLLLFGAARPELLEQHPEFARYLGAATGADAPVARIDLASLSRLETERLLTRLSPDLGAEVKTVLADRSGGNPFYTEELVRLFGSGRRGQTDDWLRFESLPDSLQALLTARLDALDAEHKAVLTDAAVAGQEFPIALVAAMGDRDAVQVLDILHELAGREFVRPAPRDGLQSEGETGKRFAFWHALTRDAAYSQLPRGARAEKHASAARWLEGHVGDGQSDFVEAVAHHYVAALDLYDEMDDESATDLRAPAVRALRLAGDAALAIDVTSAESHYRHAAELATTADGTRADVLLAWASALDQAGRTTEALEKAEEATRIRRAAADPGPLAASLARLSHYCDWVGDPRGLALAEEALRIAESQDPSVESLEVLAYWVGNYTAFMKSTEALRMAERAQNVADALGIPVPPRVVHFRGHALCDIGDARGLDEIRRSVDLAAATGSARDVADFSFNLADQLRSFEGPRPALAIERKALEDARRRAGAAAAAYLAGAEALDLWLLGDWDVVSSRLPDLELEFAEQRNVVDQRQARTLAALLDMARGRGDLEEDAAPLREAYDESRTSGPVEEFDQVHGAVLAAISAALDDPESTGRWLDVVEASMSDRATGALTGWFIPEACRQVLGLVQRVGGAELTQRLSALIDVLRTSRSNEKAARLVGHGLLAEHEGDPARAATQFAEAAQIWGELQAPYERAHALMAQGRSLLALKRVTEATAPIAEARKAFSLLDARPALEQADGLARQCSRSTPARPSSAAGAPGGRR